MGWLRHIIHEKNGKERDGMAWHGMESDRHLRTVVHAYNFDLKRPGRGGEEMSKLSLARWVGRSMDIP